MSLLVRVIGWLCIAFGAISAIFAVYAFIDPAGAQMSNDADPFGAAPSRSQIAFQFVFSLVVAALGAFMAKRKRRP